MSSRNHKTVVFYFHSVSWKKNPKWVRKYLTHELDLFIYLLDWLHSESYHVIPLEEAHKNHYLFSEKTACLTFDDGYADFFIFVYPLLKKYQYHGTVFVSPLLVNPHSTIRKTWDLKIENASHVEQWGYLTWSEMREMEGSGWVSVESHTMTHLKYPKSDKIVDFHRPGSNCMYPIGECFPDRMWNYIEDAEFEKLLPYGYPFFEQGSAVVTRRRNINPNFVAEVVEVLKSIGFPNVTKEVALQSVQDIYLEYQKEEIIFTSEEGDEDFNARLEFEIAHSKKEIEHQLQKKVLFLCWPHGDNDNYTHQMAIKSGYWATTLGSKMKSIEENRIPQRFTIQPWKGSYWLGKLKMQMKISAYQRITFAGKLLAMLRK